jgi:hypothetical protein
MDPKAGTCSVGLWPHGDRTAAAGLHHPNSFGEILSETFMEDRGQLQKEGHKTLRISLRFTPWSHPLILAGHWVGADSGAARRDRWAVLYLVCCNPHDELQRSLCLCISGGATRQCSENLQRRRKPTPNRQASSIDVPTSSVSSRWKPRIERTSNNA